MAAASTCLEQILRNVPTQVLYRFGEHAWLFATASVRLPFPYGQQVRNIALQCLDHIQKRIAAEKHDVHIDRYYSDDLWAFKAARLLDYQHDIVLDVQPELHDSWRSSLEDLSPGDEWVDRWNDWLHSGLVVWSTLGVRWERALREVWPVLLYDCCLRKPGHYRNETSHVSEYETTRMPKCGI